MATVRYDVHIDRTPDEVYAAVADVAGMPKWFPGMKEASLDGDRRTMTLEMGIDLVEQVVTNDAALRRYQYSIVEGIPLEHHLGTVDVLPDGDGSRVVYGTDIRPDELAGIVGPATEGGLAGLKALLES